MDGQLLKLQLHCDGSNDEIVMNGGETSFKRDY